MKFTTKVIVCLLGLIVVNLIQPSVFFTCVDLGIIVLAYIGSKC